MDTHFFKISDDYHQLNRDVHGASTDVELTSNENLVTMRTEQIALKDQSFAYLKAKDIYDLIGVNLASSFVSGRFFRCRFLSSF